MSSIKPKQGQCIDCVTINPDAAVKYIMADRCIIGPDFHYQKHKQSQQREKAKNKLPKSITLKKPTNTWSKEKSLPQLLKLAQDVFNEFIRKRDSLGDHFKCISCNRRKGLDQMNAGHFYSAGNHSYLRFNENNVHGQCIQCNCYMHGNLNPYRINIEKKIGSAELHKLDLFKNESQKWNKVQLKALIQIYRDKIKNLTILHI